LPEDINVNIKSHKLLIFNELEEFNNLIGSKIESIEMNFHKIFDRDDRFEFLRYERISSEFDKEIFKFEY